MASSAAYLDMFSRQRKAGCSVIKGRQAVLTIMTGKTVNPKFLIMLEHKRAILYCMTGIATRHICGE
jgi:hypothetical protein